MPIRRVYAEAGAEWSTVTGAALRGELGARLGQNLAGFVFGEWRPAETRVGAGVRVTF